MEQGPNGMNNAQVMFQLLSMGILVESQELESARGVYSMVFKAGLRSYLYLQHGLARPLISHLWAGTNHPVPEITDHWFDISDAKSPKGAKHRPSLCWSDSRSINKAAEYRVEGLRVGDKYLPICTKLRLVAP